MARKKKEDRKKKGELPSGSVRRLVYVGKGPDGKRMYKSFTAADKDALDIAVGAWKAARAAGEEEAEQQSALTVKAAVERYIGLKRAVLSPATIKAYLSVSKTYIDQDSIGRRDVNRLTQQDIQLWVSTLAEKVSPKTVRNALALMRSSVKMFRPGWSPDVTLPQKKPSELYCPSDTDIKRLLAHVTDRELRIAILLAAFGPMRRSELMALESSDIHGNTVTISKALVQADDGSWQLKAPKTEGSFRTVELPPFVIQEMAGIEGRIIKCSVVALSDRFKRAIKSSGCPHFRFHDLRHYGASIMHAIGVPDQYIMERGGWSSDYVMKRVYRNVIKEEKQKQTAVINDHFSNLLSS